MKKLLCVMIALMIIMMASEASAGLFNWDDKGKVAYIAGWVFDYYSENEQNCLRFQFTNKNKDVITASADVEIKITGENGEELYSGKHKIEQEDYYRWSNAFKKGELYATIFIDPNEIAKTSSGEGTVTFEVQNGMYFHFEEIEIKTDDLPTVPLEDMYKLEIPSLPQKVSRSFIGEKLHETEVTEIEYEFTESFSGVNLKIYFTGKKTYDSDGKSNSDSCWIGWKLYDEEGYVVKSGTALTQDVCEGEGFKRYEETIWSLEKGTYRLELTSVN